ncbi:50S ribosomal protein L22 [Candidatus Babeliales bacterium]|nr:50S ribosomal protein L22 [Candidatus Babeliales bacterium]
MLVKAKSKYIRVSPKKLRAIVDVIRGYSADKAIMVLKNCSLKRSEPIEKLIFSAFSNGKNLSSDVKQMSDLFIKDIRVDVGPVIKYFKPGAMGRASTQRKRLSHLQVVLETKDNKK